ncbi:sre-5 [Pristionchus pacificus]|uniref:Sre-5 n=1 Tax=Pristionchus pacificus TaxID=54126 RepID=A0A2A6BVW7_PRIPA|nr:sre-5 [Pristionchus pacificus]|eukprot:PDM69901.1 sre-5 [Pristionchus pacificus]
MSAHRFGDVLVFIPIYGDCDWVKPGVSKTFYYFLIVVEFIVMMYQVIQCTLGMSIIRKSSIFHRNMLNLGIIYLANAYFHIVPRSVLVFVQLKIFVPNETQFATWPNAVIILATILRSYQGLVTVVVFGSIIIERFFATIYLYDYESNKRTWISYLLVFWTIFFALSLALSRTFNSNNLTTAVTMNFVRVVTYIPAALAIGMIIFNHLRVKRILLSDRYSLAAKFQLQENLKAFKFLLLIIVWIVTGFGCAGLVMLYRDRHLDDNNIYTLCSTANDTLLTISAACGVTTCFLTQREWRLAMRTKLVTIISILRCRSPRELPPAPAQPPPSLRRRNRSNRIDDESAVYFNNLFSDWDKVYVAKQARRR